jgi:hypothetical protein
MVAALAELRYQLEHGDDGSGGQLDMVMDGGVSAGDLARAGVTLDPQNREFWVLVQAILTLASGAESVAPTAGIDEDGFDEQLGLMIDAAVGGEVVEAASHLLLLCSLIDAAARERLDAYSIDAALVANHAARVVVGEDGLYLRAVELLDSLDSLDDA